MKNILFILALFLASNAQADIKPTKGLATGEVTTSKLANGSVTTPKLHSEALIPLFPNASLRRLDIRQEADDDVILELQSSDIAHAMTGAASASAYMSIQKNSGPSGGATITGFTDTGTASPLVLRGVFGAANATGGVGAIEATCYTTDGGTSITAMASAADTCFEVTNAGTPLISVLQEGNVGIGTASPDATLHVNGDTYVGSGATVSTFTATGMVRPNVPATEVISGGGTITADACGGFKRLTSGGVVTTSTTDTFTDATSEAVNGCIMHVCNIGGNNITLDDNAKTVLLGGDIVLAPNSCVIVGASTNTGVWYQMAPVAVNG